MTGERRRVFALLGATATGKTAVSEWAARRYDLDIVCADARQVFAAIRLASNAVLITYSPSRTICQGSNSAASMRALRL